jgi:3-methyladenine DNA glycosylase/8-oxoguanine DNA glycosylase
MSEKQPETRRPTDDPWEDLVIGILSVNQYSLERTYRLVDGFRTQGLFQPENLMRWDPSGIVDRLKSAGCDRGQFMTNLFALRLSALGMLIQAKGIEACTSIIAGRDTKMIEELLLPVNGIGPKVLANFYLLLGTPQK